MSGEYDVVVVGGGMAGCAAAVTAARMDCRTLLVEQFGFLGGWATAALVNPFMSHRTSDGQPLVSGFFDELRLRLAELGGLVESSFDPEVMKFVLQEIALESGVELRLHTFFGGARFAKDGRIVVSLRSKPAAQLIEKSNERPSDLGEAEIRCQRLIDCSGDGDAALSLGADYSMGDENGLPQAATLMFDLGGVDIVKVMTYVRDHPDQMLFPKLPPDADPQHLVEGVISVAGYYELVASAKAVGDYNAPGDMIFFISRPRIGEVVFNTTHIGNVDGTNAYNLTRAEIEGRKQMMSIVAFVKKYVPGFEDSYLLRSAAHVGIRETRRIVGDYVFSAEDVIKGHKFPDCICRLAYPVDVHSGKGEGYTREESSDEPSRGTPPPGDWYEIPYRCLLPKGLENVLVAGRCVSSTQAGHGAIRIMPACIAMGQAAGVAASLSIHRNVSPRELDVGLLIKTLREQGAMV